MKTVLKLALVIGVVAMASGSVFSQDWSKDQQAVWQVVTDSWAKMNSGDMDGFAANIHEKYQGWNNISPLPLSKETALKWYKENASMMKMTSYDLNPARIVVTGDAAVVDYYFYATSTTTVGDKKTTNVDSGKNVEFYVKEGGKWMLLGDMTVLNQTKPDEK